MSPPGHTPQRLQAIARCQALTFMEKEAARQKAAAEAEAARDRALIANRKAIQPLIDLWEEETGEMVERIRHHMEPCLAFGDGHGVICTHTPEVYKLVSPGRWETRLTMLESRNVEDVAALVGEALGMWRLERDNAR